MDLALIASESTLDAGRLRAAIETKFGRRASHELPTSLPLPPADSRVPYGRMARTVGLDAGLEAGFDSAARMLVAILGRAVQSGTWDPVARSWSRTRCRGGADARHGIRLPTLSLNLRRARTYAERMFRHVVVRNPDRADAWDALGIPLAGSGRSLALSPIGQIVEDTAGYLYLLQFFGAYVCRSAATPGVSPDDYWAVEAGLLHELDLAFFEDRLEGASPTEQGVLEAMARERGRSRWRDCIARCRTCRG